MSAQGTKRAETERREREAEDLRRKEEAAEQEREIEDSRAQKVAQEQAREKEARIAAEITEVVEACANGDFSKRLETEEWLILVNDSCGSFDDQPRRVWIFSGNAHLSSVRIQERKTF